jgi:hypothetical protein
LVGEVGEVDHDGSRQVLSSHDVGDTVLSAESEAVRSRVQSRWCQSHALSLPHPSSRIDQSRAAGLGNISHFEHISGKTSRLHFNMFLIQEVCTARVLSSNEVVK